MLLLRPETLNPKPYIHILCIYIYTDPIMFLEGTIIWVITSNPSRVGLYIMLPCADHLRAEVQI